jgi:hypothetical protein
MLGSKMPLVIYIVFWQVGPAWWMAEYAMHHMRMC